MSYSKPTSCSFLAKKGQDSEFAVWQPLTCYKTLHSVESLAMPSHHNDMQLRVYQYSKFLAQLPRPTRTVSVLPASGNVKGSCSLYRRGSRATSQIAAAEAL